MNGIHWEHFAPFSHPGIIEDEGLLAGIASVYTNAAIEKVLHIEHARDHTSNLANALDVWRRKEKSFEDVWHATIGKIARYGFEERLEGWDERLLRVALDVSDQLDEYHFSCKVSSGAPILIGKTLLDARGFLDLNHCDRTLHVNISNASKNGRIEYNYVVDKLSVNSIKAISIEMINGIKILETNQSSEEICEESPYWIPIKFEKVGLFGRHLIIREGLAAIKEVMPEYLNWVLKVIKMIVVIGQIENTSCSGSWADASGVIYMSQPSSALEAAEILIHEGSHQYFHILEKVASTRKKNDTRLFYSPPVGRERPIDRILIAYHAFANVLIFYATAFKKNIGHNDREAFNRFEVMKKDVEFLENTLITCNGLSELGEIIFHPLRSRLSYALSDVK